VSVSVSGSGSLIEVVRMRDDALAADSHVVVEPTLSGAARLRFLRGSSEFWMHVSMSDLAEFGALCTDLASQRGGDSPRLAVSHPSPQVTNEVKFLVTGATFDHLLGAAEHALEALADDRRYRYTHLEIERAAHEWQAWVTATIGERSCRGGGA
jgi:hypothetical protein